MSHVFWMTGSLALLIASVCPPAAAQVNAGAAQVTIADGIDLALSMSGVTPGTRPLQSTVRVHDGELYRLIVDGAGYARFAYAVRVEPRAAGVELMLRPVRLHEAVTAFAPRQRAFTLPFKLDSGLNTLPDTQWSGDMRAGDTLTLDLFHQPGTHQRIGDIVTLASVTNAGLARLKALRDQRREARPELTVAGITIRRDGRILNGDRPGTFATGHAVGLGLADAAVTVLFSAEPPQTEAPYGVAAIDGRTLRFTLDGHEYECTATDPIGPAGLTSVWLYVRREPLPFVKGYFVLAGESIDKLMAIGRTDGQE